MANARINYLTHKGRAVYPWLTSPDTQFIPEGQYKTGLIAAKVQARREGHMLGFEEVAAECEGITAERADIGIQIERPFRLYRNAEPQLAQGGQQEVATAPEFSAPLLQNAQGLRGKTGQCRVLRHARRTDVEILRELLQFFLPFLPLPSTSSISCCGTSLRVKPTSKSKIGFDCLLLGDDKKCLGAGWVEALKVTNSIF